MSNKDWDAVVRTLRSLKEKDVDELDTQWLICYNDGTRKLVLDHSHDNLEDVLQAFEDFCKGAGFIFHGFAIVDEDGIPVNGLNPLAKLEIKDEDQTG
jgi:hypothetical protein